MSARDAILDAAASLAAAGGVLALGVEAVVRAAGVSKGSFFYHFRTKDDMVLALLEHVAQGFDADIAALMTWGHRFTDAFIETTIAEASGRKGLVAVLIAAVALDPGLAGVVRVQIEAWTERMVVEDGLERGRAETLRLILDGLLLSSIFYDGQRPAGWEKRLRVELIRLSAAVPPDETGAQERPGLLGGVAVR